jgi:hypothetical protein
MVWFALARVLTRDPHESHWQKRNLIVCTSAGIADDHVIIDAMKEDAIDELYSLQVMQPDLVL